MVFNASINSKFNIPFLGILTFENSHPPTPPEKIVFKCPTYLFFFFFFVKGKFSDRDFIHQA